MRNIEVFINGLHDYIGKALRSASAENRSRIDDLQNRLERLERIENKGVVYRGLWDASAKYVPGDMATYGGNCWHCNVGNNGVRPNSGHGIWQLAVKRGRDARG